MAFVLHGCGLLPSEKAHAEAARKGTSEAYQEYLDKYPDAIGSATAKKRIAELKARETAQAQSAQEAAKVRAVIQKYVVGSTTHDQFLADAKAEDWEINISNAIQIKSSADEGEIRVYYNVGSRLSYEVCMVAFWSDHGNMVLALAQCGVTE